MKASDLYSSALEGRIFSIEGDDTYWRSYAERFFTEQIPADIRDFQVTVLGGLSGLKDIYDAVITLPLFSEKRLVLVKDGQYKEKENDKPHLLAAIDAADEDTYLVFSNVSFLTPAAKKKMTVIDVSRLDAFELKKKLPSLFPGGIDMRAADLLIEYTGRDMERIHGEAQKLNAYAGGKKISAEDVQLLVANDAENEIYEFTNAAAGKNFTLAISILDRFLARGASYPFLLSSLTSQYRRMLYAALSPLNDRDLAMHLGTKEYAVKKAREAAAKYSKVRLKKCLDALAGVEYAFKSGTMAEDSAFSRAMSAIVINE